MKGEGGDKHVIVLFDSGSHRSFVKQSAARSLRLPIVRREWLTINTFGNSPPESAHRDIVRVELRPLGGGDAKSLEAFVVPEISTIPNVHIERVKHSYSNLRGIWFSDVDRGASQLQVDVLVGSDYLWEFHGRQTIRGEADQPVAVETALGWVLSGPLRGEGEQESQMNLVSQHCSSEPDSSLEAEIRELWNLDVLGIIEKDEVHEAFVNNLSFNGVRYSVKLPWKRSHELLPSNYTNSLGRLRGLLRKLR